MFLKFPFTYLCSVKKQIIQKSSELFLRYGFKSVTMDDIANELGISKKTIYAHFENKTKLVQACTLFIFEEINQGIQQICGAGFSPIEEIFEIKTQVMRQTNNEESSPMYQLQKYYPKIYKSIRETQFESLQNCVLNNLERGIEMGYYRKDIDIDFITRLYFNGVIGIRNLELFPIEKYSLTYLMDSYLNYHLRAITTEKGLKILLKIQQ